MKISPSHLLAITLSVLNCGTAWSYSTQWMARTVQKRACIESLGSVASSETECWSWTKRETAKPFFDESHSRILVGGTDGALHVVEQAKGKTTKRVALEGNLVAGLVLASEGRFVFATDRGIAYAMDKNDLSVAWKTELDSGVLQTPSLFDDQALFVTQLGTLYSLSQKSGEVIWFKKRELPNRIFLRHLSTPTTFSSQISGSNRQVLAIGNPNGKLEFLDANNGEALEEIVLGDSKTPFGDVATTPVLGRRLVYAASYNTGLVAFDRESRIRRWDVKEKGITEIATQSGVLVIAGAESVSGGLFVSGIDAENGTRLWRRQFEKGAPSGILVRDGEVIVGSDSNGLYVLDLFSGKTVQTLGSVLGFAGGIESVGDNLLALSSSGALFMFNRFDRVVSAKSIARE